MLRACQRSKERRWQRDLGNLLQPEDQGRTWGEQWGNEEKREPAGLREDSGQEAAQLTYKCTGLDDLGHRGRLPLQGGRGHHHGHLCRLGTILLLLLGGGVGEG